MKQNNYCVYIHKNKINGKVYIGITRTSVEKRWGKNGNGYKPYYGRKNYFWNAIQKYGWDIFEHEILHKNLSKELAEKIEISLIKKYDSTNPKKGYNIQNGGTGIGCHSEETKKYISAIQKKNVYRYDRFTGVFIDKFDSTIDAENILNISNSHISAVCLGKMKTTNNYFFSYEYLGKKLPKEKIEWINKNNSCIKVAKYDLSGNLIGVYNSKSEAEKTIKNKKNPIINFRNKTSYGFIWKKVNDSDSINKKMPDDELKEYTTSKYNCKKCYQYDMDGNFVNSFNNTVEASKFINASQSNIASACRSEIITSNNYYWRYASDNYKFGENLPKEEIQNHKNPLSKTVYMYDMNLKLIKIYDSITIAANEMKTSTSNICKVCKGKAKTAKGFIWSYEELNDVQKIA